MKLKRRAAALVIALVTLMVVMLIAGTVARSLVGSHRQSRRAGDEVQAQWLAEAALARGLVKLRSQADYSGETWRPEVTPANVGVAEIRVERPADQPARIVVQARYPDDPWQRASVHREVPLAPKEDAP